jgi:hypothetical protein
MADGPGEMQGLANWLHHNEPSAKHTNDAIREIQCKQKVNALVTKYPDLERYISTLKSCGCNYRQIVDLLGIADMQFTFVNGTAPPNHRRYHPVWEKDQPQSN